MSGAKADQGSTSLWLDRFERSFIDCLANLRELDSHGVCFMSITQAVDTDNRNPASDFLLAAKLAGFAPRAQHTRYRSQDGIGIGTAARVLQGRAKGLWRRTE